MRRGLTVGRFTEDAALERKDLVGSQDRRVRVPVMTLARLELAQGVRDVPGGRAVGLQRGTNRGLVDSNRLPIEGNARANEDPGAGFRSGGEDKSGQNHHCVLGSSVDRS